MEKQQQEFIVPKLSNLIFGQVFDYSQKDNTYTVLLQNKTARSNVRYSQSTSIHGIGPTFIIPRGSIVAVLNKNESMYILTTIATPKESDNPNIFFSKTSFEELMSGSGDFIYRTLEALGIIITNGGYVSLAASQMSGIEFNKIGNWSTLNSGNFTQNFFTGQINVKLVDEELVNENLNQKSNQNSKSEYCENKNNSSNSNNLNPNDDVKRLRAYLEFGLDSFSHLNEEDFVLREFTHLIATPHLAPTSEWIGSFCNLDDEVKEIKVYKPDFLLKEFRKKFAGAEDYYDTPSLFDRSELKEIESRGDLYLKDGSYLAFYNYHNNFTAKGNVEKLLTYYCQSISLKVDDKVKELEFKKGCACSCDRESYAKLFHCDGSYLENINYSELVNYYGSVKELLKYRDEIKNIKNIDKDIKTLEYLKDKDCPTKEDNESYFKIIKRDGSQVLFFKSGEVYELTGDVDDVNKHLPNPFNSNEISKKDYNFVKKFGERNAFCSTRDGVIEEYSNKHIVFTNTNGKLPDNKKNFWDDVRRTAKMGR